MDKSNWDVFTEFAQLSLSTGEPDSHLSIMTHTLKGLDRREQLWRVGCYIMPYAIGSAAALWSHLRAEDVVNDPAAMESWVTDNWDSLPIRRERRVVRGLKKFLEGLHGYAEWSLQAEPWAWADYDTAWNAVGSIRYSGRYATMKMTELLLRAGLTSVAMPDIRADGGKNPRKTLAWLWGLEPSRDFLRSNSREMVKHVEGLASESHAKLTAAGVDASMFQLEVMLCNFQQAIKWRFPGYSHDSERVYFEKCAKSFGANVMANAIDFWGIRKELFPAECLGEVSGWAGLRKELFVTFPEHGYFWCDTKFDYTTTTDLLNPVKQ